MQKQNKWMLIVSLIYSSLVIAQETEWLQLKGEQTLREFMSGLKTERKLPSGNNQSADYQKDGTGILISWGAKFPRTWEVKGDDQICFNADSQITCVTLEKNTVESKLFRIRDVVSGQHTEFTVTSKLATGKDVPEPGSKGGAAAPTAEEIAAELANPNTVLGTLNTNFDYTTFKGTNPGANDQSSMVIGFQPSLPYPLGEGKNFFVRPLVPIIVNKPFYDAGLGAYDEAEFELGDIGFDAAYGQSFTADGGANVVIGGIAGSIPTATSDNAGSDQWTLGPELGAFMVRKWGVIGILASHQWDVAGEDSFDTNITSGQYAYIFSAGGGWQIIGTPTWSYNHEASSDNAITFPVGIGVAKTAILGGRPWKFSVQYWNYVESPDNFGAEHLIRFTVGPVVDLPWKGLKK